MGKLKGMSALPTRGFPTEWAVGFVVGFLLSIPGAWAQTSQPTSRPGTTQPTSRPAVRAAAKRPTPHKVPARTLPSKPILTNEKPSSRPTSRPAIRKNVPKTKMVVRAVPKRPMARRVIPSTRSHPPRRRVKPKVALRPPVRRANPPAKKVRNVLPLFHPFPSLARVTNLELGTPLARRSSVGTVSWVRVRVAEKGWYQFDSTGKSDPFCRLYNSKYHLLARNDDSGAKRNCRILKFLRKGTYFWEVMLFPYKSERFKLVARKLPVGSLKLNKWFKSSIAQKGTLRLFKAHVKKGGYYSVSTKGTTDVLCAQLHSTSPANSFVAQDDDSGPSTNCDMRLKLEPGRYVFLVKGAYFKKKGKFSIRIKPKVEQRLEFFAITFGETMRARLATSAHRHRYHFRLSRAQRVSFLVRFRRNIPQIRLLDLNGKVLPARSYALDSLGRVRILSQSLAAGEYYVELRSPGKPRYRYNFWAYKDRAVDLPSNRAQLLSQGIPPIDDTPSYQYALFRIDLSGHKHFVISSLHPKVSFCSLETPSGQLVTSRRSSRAEPGVCRLKGSGLKGRYWVRVVLERRRRSYPKPLTEALTALAQSLGTTSNMVQRLFREWLVQQRLAKKKPRRGLPLLNPSQAPQIRLYQFVPTLLSATVGQRVKPNQGVVGAQINVTQPDLYLISARGKSVAGCRVLDLMFRFIKQTPVTRNGCEIAAYLLHGSYLLRVTTANDAPIQLVWRKFRARPRVLNTDGVVVGPLGKGAHHDVRVRIAKPSFYLLYSQLVSSVSLVTRLRLYKGTKKVVRFSVKPYAILAYLNRGLYRLRVKIANGRGAFSLYKKRIKARALVLKKKLRGVLTKSNPRHFFHLKVKSRQFIRFETLGRADTYCWLYNAKGSRIGRNNNTGKKLNCQISKYLRAGNYLLEVGVVRQRGGPFQVWARSVTLKPINVLRVGKAISSRLKSRKDIHRYRIRIRRKGMYVIATRTPAGSRTDPKCYLYQKGRLRRFNDDSGPRFNCSIVQKLKPGTYTLVIKLAWSTRKGPYKVGLYRAGQPFPGTKPRKRPKPRTRPRPRRPNTSKTVKPSTGWVLLPGQRVQALVVRKSRVDVYRLQIRYSGQYRIVTDGNLDTKCYLDDVEGNAMKADEDSGPAANCQINATLPKGLYIIRILARPVGRLGPYGLRIVVK